MPSVSCTHHLLPLLRDAEDFESSRDALRRDPLVRFSLHALSRATVVVCVSAWEAYIEELVRESLALLRPVNPPLGTWPALNASVRGLLGRFNTPNTDQIRQPLADALGLHDIQHAWTWPNFTAAKARERLQEVMEYRHQIAHGVNPRPIIGTLFTRNLPQFFRRLARCTDDRVRQYLAADLGIADPWPA